MTNLERLLEQSKKIRDAATPGPWPERVWTGPLEWHDGVKDSVLAHGPIHKFKGLNFAAIDDSVFISHARNTHEIKDQMIAVLINALDEMRRVYNIDSKIALETIAKIEQLAAQALGEK